MKCPYCNEEMEIGYLQNSRGIFWSTKKHNFLFIPNIKNGDIYISNDDPWGSYVETFLCKKCNVMLSPLNK